MKKNITLLIILLSIGFHAILVAATFTSIQNGAWNDPATWDQGQIPNVTNSSSWPGDNVIIQHTVTYAGNLTTAKQSSITIENGGTLDVSGQLDIGNTSNAFFTLQSGGNLSANTLRISGSSATVSLAGTVTVYDMLVATSKAISASGTLNISNNLTFTSGNGTLNLNGAVVTVGNNTSLGGSSKITFDGGTEAQLGNLSMTGSADVLAQGTGGVLAYTSLSLANSSTTIQCLDGTVYSGAASSPIPPNPIDLVDGTQGILPVQLIDFTVEAGKYNTISHWITAAEVDNDYFRLEWSNDGTQYRSIAIVKGIGFSTREQNYQHSSAQLSSGTHYFRLWQTDFDGTTELLATRKVVVESDIDDINISPNPVPVGNAINIGIEEGLNPSFVYLVSVSGQQWPLYLSPGSQRLSLPEDLAAGYYYIRMKTNNGWKTTSLMITP